MFGSLEFWDFLCGVIAGGLGGALVTLKIVKKTQNTGASGNSVDQTRAKAAGDIVGRDKRS